MGKTWRKAMKLFDNHGKVMIIAGHSLIYDAMFTYFYMYLFTLPFGSICPVDRDMSTVSVGSREATSMACSATAAPPPGGFHSWGSRDWMRDGWSMNWLFLLGKFCRKLPVFFPMKSGSLSENIVPQQL